MKLRKCSLIAVAVVGGCLAGCTGLNTWLGHRQSKLYEWRENGSFWAEAYGTGNEEFEMTQKTTSYNDDGTVASVDEYSLRVKPNHGQAGATMAAGFEASTKNLQAITDLIGNIAPQFAPAPTPEPVP